MKRLLLFLALVLPGVRGSAQLTDRIAQKYGGDSIRFAFTQTRHTEMLEEDLVSEGHFRFDKPDKVEIEITAPEARTISFRGAEAKGPQRHIARYVEKTADALFDPAEFQIQEKDGCVILVPQNPELKRIFSRLTLFAGPDGTLSCILLEDRLGYTRLDLH